MARRSPEEPFRSPRALSLVRGKDLQNKRPRTVPEALLEQPGVYVQKTNHGGGAPIIRGAVGPQVLLLVDGVRLNASTYRSGPSQYLNTINPWTVAQIEVLRGPGSILYGSDAFGGVISVLTRDPPLQLGKNFRYQGVLLGKYSSADQEKTGHALLGFGAYGFGLLGSASYGDFGDLTAGDEVGRQAYSSYQNAFFDAKIRWRLAPHWYLRLLYQNAQVLDAGRADQLRSKDRLRFYNNYRHLAYLDLRGKIGATRLRLTLSYHLQEEEQDSQSLDSAHKKILKSTILHDTVGTLGFSFHGESPVLSWLDLVYGADLYHDMVNSEARTRSGDAPYRPTLANFPNGSSYTTGGLYLLGRLWLWRQGPRNGLYLHLGDRVSGFFARAPKRESFAARAFNKFGNTLYAGLQLLLLDSFNASLTYAEGFRAPNLQETVSIGDMGNFFEIPNPDLAPEISRTLELTLRGKWRDRFTVFASGYASFWQDLLQRIPATYKEKKEVEGKQVMQNTNTDQARVLGIEAGVGLRLWRSWSVSGHLTWTRGRAFPREGGEEALSRIPPLFATVATRYQFGERGFVEFYLQAANSQTALSTRDQKDPRIPPGGTPGWVTLNLRGAARLHRYFRLTFTLENLLNETYKIHGSGVYAPGRSARLTLELLY